MNDIELTITEQGKQLLTPRECQVLLADAEGKTDKMMARELGISPSAICAYNERIYRKLQLHNASINLRAAALVRAIAYGVMTVSVKAASYEVH